MIEHETQAPSLASHWVDVEGIVRPGFEFRTTQEPGIIVERGSRQSERRLERGP